jgi:hypothetical protein
LIRILAAGVAAIGIGVPQASAEVRVHLAAHGSVRSATVAVPVGATVAGVRAHGAMPRTIEVRAAGGWVALDAVGGGFTEPVWIGRVRHLQVRVRGGGRIGVVFVRPGPDPPSVRTARARTVDPGQPPIISRAGWGADESIRRGSPVYFDRLGVVFVHHTDSASQYAAADVPALIRGFYRFHVLSRGWFDIGYNYLVDRYGRIYEGRSGGITRNVRGAQVAGLNTGSAGIALIGTYNSIAPTDAQWTALRDLITWRLDLAHLDPLGTSRLVSGGSDRFAAGTTVPLKVISGHRDGGFTDCPGTVAYQKLPALRAEIAALPLLRIYNPVVAPAGIDQSTGLLPLRFTAKLSAASPWHVTVTDAAGQVVRDWGGAGTVVDVTWADTPPVTLDGLRWTIEAGTARPAQGGFDDLASAPSADVIRGAGVTAAGDGTVAVRYALTTSATVSVAITDLTGKLVKVLDPGTRHTAGSRRFVFAGRSGHYRAVLRMARSAGTATVTLPFDVRRGVAAVTLKPAIVNLRGPSRVALRMRRLDRVLVRVRVAGLTRTIRAGPPGRTGANLSTTALPEGRLTVRISAATAGGTQVVTRSLLVDRTRPRATRLSYRRGVLRGTLSERATVAVGSVRRTFGRGRFALHVRVLHTIVLTDLAGNVKRTPHP